MITERKTFPEFPDDVYGQMRKNDLKRVTKEIFKLEPLIFHKLKQRERKCFNYNRAGCGIITSAEN